MCPPLPDAQIHLGGWRSIQTKNLPNFLPDGLTVGKSGSVPLPAWLIRQDNETQKHDRSAKPACAKLFQMGVRLATTGVEQLFEVVSFGNSISTSANNPFRYFSAHC